MTDFDTGLGKNAANYIPLSPIDYLRRAAEVYGKRTAIIHGGLQQTWAETDLRCRKLAGALRQLGVERPDHRQLLAQPFGAQPVGHREPG